MDVFTAKKKIKTKNKILDVSGKLLMGVINLTPDSFYTGSRFSTLDAILGKANQHLEEGADIIDLGAYSSRPGAEDITAEEEIKRLFEPLTEIRKSFPEAVLSVDTFHSAVAETCLKAGADMINDISAGLMDPRIVDVVADFQVPYIIMHMKGSPQNMQHQVVYDNVVREVVFFLAERLAHLKDKGICDIIIDPGFGFGKTTEHNFDLLSHLSLFKTFNEPLLAGLSRKSMIYRTLNISPEEALNGTTVLNTIALVNGADILRVHDVKPAREVINLLGKTKSAGIG